jgi:hypothetical protein
MSYTLGEAASVHRRDATTQTDDAALFNAFIPEILDAFMNLRNPIEPENMEGPSATEKPKSCVEDTVKDTDKPQINEEPEIDDDKDTVWNLLDGIEYRRDATTQTGDAAHLHASQAEEAARFITFMPQILTAFLNLRNPTEAGNKEPENDKEPSIDDDDDDFTVKIMHPGPSTESGNRNRGAPCQSGGEKRAPKRRRKEY